MDYMLKRLMVKVDTNGRTNETMTQCWKSLGSISTGGYGQITIDRVHYHTHRLSWWLHNGMPEILSNQQVGHKCDNPTCCNPEHLELITPSKNAKDAIDRGLRKSRKRPTIRISNPCESCITKRKKCSEGEGTCDRCIKLGTECIRRVRIAHETDFKKGENTGEANPNCKISNETKELIIARYKAGLKYGELKQMSKEYGMSYNWIQKLVQGHK